ncbi:CU044_5270 family protein [Streptomyces cellostaticus]|uniref:CU044_5270 family protein n=1 Tax=Streptomyces cellostaticus TaxID=67285 RepID=UPI002026B0ED|nr:CU044_5270 family protein [Streptomyces cellostaticus]
MDELMMVRTWDTDRDGLSDPARSAARARLEAAMAKESEGVAPRAGRLSRRIVLRTGLAGVTAAAAGAAIVTLGGGSDRTPRLAAVSAADVLRRAADRTRARGGDLPVPRDDQYFYTRTRITRVPVKGGRTRTWTDESWMSVDGSKPSLRQEYGKVHHDPPLGRHEVRWPPTVYSELQAMPTDPDELLARFKGNDSAPNSDVIAFMEGCMLLMGPRVMPPGLQAGAFEALSRLPRIRLEDEADVSGRRAVGVSYPQASFTFLFDRGTYDYLGLRTRGSSPKKVGGEWKQTNPYLETRTLEDIEVVDRVGQHG